MSSGLSEKELLGWFEKDLLPRLVTEDRFPVPGAVAADLIISSVEFEDDPCKGVDSFASTPFFLKLTLHDRNNRERLKEFRLIVKFITQNLGCRAGMETDVQFFNEMVFYHEVVPAFETFLKDRPGVDKNFLKTIFPVCRYAHIDMNSPDYGIVIMDDLRTENFGLAASKAELSLEYCLLAVKKIAQMHALSYAMKLEKYPGFFELASKCRDCRYQDDRLKKETFDTFYRITSGRAIEYLRSKKDCEVPESYLDLLKAKIDPEGYKEMQRMVVPIEPIAVICHGDFCRNNIMFRFQDKKPTDVRLFDFQTWRYSNPSVDLTFFIYMNTTLELRTKHFDGILNEYYKSLTETVTAITSKSASDVENLLPRESFLKDFADRSLFGYVIAAFFLPMMMVPRKDFDFETEWSEKTNLEMALENAAHGGEPASQRLSEIIIDMYRRRFYLD